MNIEKIDWKLIIAIIALTISIFAGSFWRRADVVFDTRAVEIPLSEPLRKNIEAALSSAPSDSVTVAVNGRQAGSSTHLPSAKLPDKLLYVDLRNVGHVPSGKVIARIVVPGEIADKEVRDAGSALGQVTELSESDSTGTLSFACQNFANHPGARINIALWYQQTKAGSATVEIQDTSVGPAREVPAVDSASFYWWDFVKQSAGLIVPLSAILGGLATIFIQRKTKLTIQRLRDFEPDNKSPE